MASISVDIYVELDEFGTDELIEELTDRLKRSYKYYKQTPAGDKRVSDRLATLTGLIKDLYTEIIGAQQIQLEHPVGSILDQMKMEYINQVFEKYTLNQIENALPS